MPAESKKYLINIKKLGKSFNSPKDCVDTLYDEFRLESKISSGRVRVTVYNENQYEKLKKFLRKYKAPKEYIEEVMGSEEYKLKKTKSIKEQKEIKNNTFDMNTKKRLSLNEAYFDQRAYGVQPVSMDEVFSMIPSRLRNGKKVIVFLHDSLLNEFKQRGSGLRYEFGVAPFERIENEIGFTELLTQNLRDVKYDVFVITFANENVIDGFEMDPNLARRYSTVVVDSPEVLEPDEIGYEEDYPDTDPEDQIQESLSYRRKASLNESKKSLNHKPSLNESWLDEEDDEDIDDMDDIEDEEPEETNDDPNLVFVDELVDKYYIDGEPSIEEFEDMILDIKEYVDDLDPDDFDGKTFCDMVGYLCRDKFGVFISEDPEFESIKYLFKGSLQESKEIRDSRRNALNEAEKAPKAPKSEFAGKSIDGKKLKDYKLLELGDLLKEKREALKAAKAEVRKEKDEKKAAKLQKNVEKLQNEIEMIQNEIKFRKKNKMNESSVRDQFNKYAKIFEEESEDISEDEEENKKDEEEPKEEPVEKEEEPKEEPKEEGEDEEVPMTAVLVKVAKSDVEKAKKQMINAGVEEDDIDEIEGDSDSDEVELKVDANSIMALKDWLKEKGVDLEEKLGGEIVAPEDNGEDDEEESKDDDKELDLDDMSFDDIFGGDEGMGSEEEPKENKES